MAEAADPAAPFAGWALLELMGHRQRPGFVQEVEVAGGKMLRIDIPTSGGDITEFYGLAAVYSLRPCTEEIVRAAVDRYSDPRPVRPVTYKDRETLPAPRDVEEDQPLGSWNG